ncbi:MAG TPA: GNAT family N-acetyltransferase [Acidimicrobiales bacterium]|nr:GNAT family N-acetyltransferase [Acidimicrobiales bacterium]
MPVRDATPADLDVIVELIGALAAYERLEHEVVLDPAELARHLFGPEPVAHVVLATDDRGTDHRGTHDSGAVVGFALWFPTFSTFLGRPGIWLEDLFVRPEARGAGHGRALIEHLRSLTDGRLEWSVLDWNEPAQGFYRSLGAAPHDGWTTWRWAPPT